jgi:1-acyl-sn-glycerol-3-phosphate acyltransferase
MSNTPENTVINSPAENDKAIMIKKPLFHSFRVVFSTVLLVFWCCFMLPVHLLWKALQLPKIEKCYFVFHGGCCWLFNLRCHVRGEISTARPTLFLSNHISYLDVLVLSKYVPAYFIAKSEVSNWPVLGWLAKEQNTLFFERNKKKVRGQITVMSDHFNREGNLILFPEGTSTEGEHIQPFKSSLLQSVELSEKEVMIQPITLAYTKYNNQPMCRQRRDQYAWYAAMPFASHFFNALGLAKADVEIIFHKPVTLNEFENRKACAADCQQRVATGLHDALTIV